MSPKKKSVKQNKHTKSHREISDALTDLNPKQAKYVEGRLAGKTKKEAALKAGYSESSADNAARIIENEDVRETFRRLIREVIPAERIVERLSEGVDAERTTSVESDEVNENGRKKYVEITEPDMRERREYLKLAVEYSGLHVPEQNINLKKDLNELSDEELVAILEGRGNVVLASGTEVGSA